MTPYNAAELPKFKYRYKGKKRQEKVCEDIFCFDIETCSYFYDKYGNVHPYSDFEMAFSHIEDPKERMEKISDSISHHGKGSCCYIWQLGINEKRFYGRTLEEFKEIFDDLCERVSHPFIVLIHNISYEYQYLRGIFGDENIEAFYTEARKPLYLKYRNAEFRCTYRLTNSSLKQWGKKIGLEKLDTLDYGKICTPLTPLDDQELAYCERDIEIMYQGIKPYLDEYGSIWNVPLTQTGRVRREIKQIFHNNYNYHRKITSTLPSTADDYKVQRWCYMGGMCFTGVENAGRIIKKPGSYDRGSAYPTQMVLRPFPSSAFMPCVAREDLFNFELYHYIFYAEISNVKSKSSISCIPQSRMFNKSGTGEYNNGKLIEWRGSFQMFLTEVDLQTYRLYYEFDIYYKKVWVALSRLLDENLVKYVLKLYGQKTILKGVDDRADEYARSKELLNSVYGCCATALIFEEHELIDNEWIDTPPDEVKMNEELTKRQKNMWKNDLSFSTGIYVTAYQRQDLLKMIAKISPKDFCYTDTDSIKLRHPDKYDHLFREENDRIRAEVMELAEHRGLDPALFEPEDQDGHKHLIGIWENEGIYERAIFLGAKRYCYEQYDKKGKLKTHVVVSGVPKAAEEGFKLKDFKDGYIFTPEQCGYKKNILFYLDGDNRDIILHRGEPDEYTVKNKYGICMYPTGYDMSLTREYKNLIDLYKNRKGVQI